MTPARSATLVALLALPSLHLLTGCSLGYVARSAWYQGELMAHREPVDRVLSEGTFDEPRRRNLELVPAIKAYGESQGLSPTGNYDTVAVGWDRTIYNLSACAPLSFEPVTWWFPVVGRVPYLGFFEEAHASRRAAGYQDRGIDVYVRPVGAYSTLGWFRDPVLPAMLDWGERRLAETVLHELAHATLWIPGHVNFNEAFASVVGEAAAMGWLAHRYGEDSAEVRAATATMEDLDRWKHLLHGMFHDLDALYRDLDMGGQEKLAEKEKILGSMEERVLSEGFHDPGPYTLTARASTWNNARLWQFRTYNAGKAGLLALLDSCNGDMGSFITTVDLVTRGAKNPQEAVAAAAGRCIAASSK